MFGSFGTNGLDAMLDHIGSNSPANVITHMSLHTADPGTAGTAEYGGGSYARQAIAFPASSGGSMSASGTPSFDIDASGTITHVGLWTAVSTGTFLGSDDLPAAESFGSAGTLSITAIDLSLS